ncbi:glycosyltransferase 61 family protein [Xanthobacter sp. V3C-3]|uniref:glycosyltransferase family 61 protein n=1 Tax=Xanthobacter lutulentifluminis TaxID=3119935 RepID=UPI0037291C19
MFTLANRSTFDSISIDDLLNVDLNRDGHIEFTPSTSEMVRPDPVYFHVSPNVQEQVKERNIRLTDNACTTRIAASYALSLRNAIVLPNSFIAISADNRIVSDSFRAFGALERAGFADLGGGIFKREINELNVIDHPAILVGIQTNNNFFHWLMEAMPRISLLEKARMRLDNYLLILPPLRPWMRDIFNFITKNKYNSITIGDTACRFRQLIVPARGLFNINTFTHHAIDLIRSIPHANSTKMRRIYISRERSSSRRITNEAEIANILALNGFEPVFPEQMSFEEQISMFSSASHVAGALGAGLTNIAFTGSGSTLIEFAPEGRTGDATLFANMCHVLDRKYACLVGEFSGGFDRPFDRRDFHVDPERLRLLLDAT